MTTATSETGVTAKIPATRRATTEISEYRQRLELLYDVAQQVRSFADVSELLEHIMRVTQRLIRAEASSLLLVDRNKKELYFHLAEGKAAKKLKDVRIDLDSGITGWVAHHGVPLVSNDVATDERFNDYLDQVTGFDTKSIMAVPVARGQNVIGVIELLNKADGDDFTEKDLAILAGFATTEAMVLLLSMAATAINVIKQHQTVQDGLKSTVETLVAVTDDKDPYTHGHSWQEQLARQEAEQAAEEKAEREADKSFDDSDSEIHEGNVRLLIVSSAGYKKIMQFNRQLDKVESLRILLIGGSGDEGSHIVVSLQKPVKLIGALNKMSIVDKVDKKGKDIVVTLRGSARTQLSRKQSFH